MLVPLSNNRVALHASADGAGTPPKPELPAAEGEQATEAADVAGAPPCNSNGFGSSSETARSNGSPWDPAAVEARIQRFIGTFAGGAPWILDAVTETKVLSENAELRRPASE